MSASTDRCAPCAAGCAVRAATALALEAVDRGPHLIDIREVPVDGCEADVRHEIEIAEPLDDEFTDRRARYLALAQVKERPFDIGNERIDRAFADRALLGGDAHGIAQLARVVLLAATV